MITYNYIIVEDEPLAMERLLEMLSKHTDFKCIGTTNNGHKGHELIEAKKPNLVFLDIEMPVLNGFEMLSKLQFQPAIIFTTAFEHYALKAFEQNSIDYLLKPIRKSRLDTAIQRFKDRNERANSWSHINKQIADLKPQHVWKSITVSSGNGFKILDIEGICYFKAEDKYVMAYDTAGKKHLLNKTLKEISLNLPDDFMQIHRSIIINFNAIKHIRKNYRSLFVFSLNDSANSEITCGPSYLQPIKNKLDL
jgi:two-component system LytT family response regulator